MLLPLLQPCPFICSPWYNTSQGDSSAWHTLPFNHFNIAFYTPMRLRKAYFAFNHLAKVHMVLTMKIVPYAHFSHKFVNRNLLLSLAIIKDFYQIYKIHSFQKIHLLEHDPINIVSKCTSKHVFVCTPI
jgi:hypothetical protein